MAGAHRPLPSADALTVIALLASLIDQAERCLPEHVYAARENGHSWHEIAQILSTSPEEGQLRDPGSPVADTRWPPTPDRTTDKPGIPAMTWHSQLVTPSSIRSGRRCRTALRWHGGPFAFREAPGPSRPMEVIGGSVHCPTSVTCGFAYLPDRNPRLYQHVLMAGITEDFDSHLRRVAMKIAPALIKQEGGPDGLLARIRMAARFRAALDREIESLVVTGQPNDPGPALLDEVLGTDIVSPARPTWQEIGEALGVSAQAAHRKYGPAVSSRAAAVTASGECDEAQAVETPATGP